VWLLISTLNRFDRDRRAQSRDRVDFSQALHQIEAAIGKQKS
jgi:hypothetical protein